MSSYEEFSKKKEQSGSYYEFAKKYESAREKEQSGSYYDFAKKYESARQNQNQNLNNKTNTKSNLISKGTSIIKSLNQAHNKYSSKVKDFVAKTSNNIGKSAMKYADSKRVSNQYENYKMPSTDEEKQQLAIEQAKKQTQNSEQQIARKKSIEEYNRIKKEREAQAIVSDEELLENLSKMPAYKRTAEIYNITKNNKDFNNLNNQVIQLQTMQKANEKAKKINEDLSNKKYLSSLAHIAKGVPIKARDSVNTTMSAINSLADSAGIVNVPTNSYIKSSGDDLLKVNKSATNEYGLTSSQINNGTVRTASNVSGTIGNMAPSILASAILPGSGRVLQAVQVGADAYQENLNDDSSNRLKSVLTGLTKGYASYAIEGLSGGNILSTGSLDDWAVKTIANKTSNKSLQKLASMIYEVGGEVLEEEVENHVDYVIDKVINNKDFPEFKDWWNETSETAKQTILSTLTLKVLGLGGNTFKDVQEYSQNADMYKWINEAEKIIDKEKLKIDTNLQQNNINNQVILPTQQITPTENKSAQNGFSEQIANNNQTPNAPMLNYQYEISDNKKINNLRQDANKYFNNTEKARNYVNMLEQIISNKDIDIRLDSNLKTADGRVANGSYSNGVITINPNSTKTGEFIAVHELTHAIGTDSMKSIIDTYRKSNIDFDNSVKSLLENYSTTELTDEALADVSAQLFGNQEFINNVSQSNPSVFKKIYNEIKYLWHQFRGYKNQDQFIDDLYYKWTQAYNSSNKLNTNNSFSIQTNSDGSKYVEVDTDQDIFEGKSVKEQTKLAQEYILNNFREKGLLKDDSAINITRKTANEYTHPKNGLDNNTYSSKMKASTELDNLLEISKFIKSETDDGRHVFAKNGWDYYETVFKVGNKTYSGWLNIANGENGKLLYDITNIKERASNYSVKTVSVANSFVNNSITPDNQNVNTITKYSTQESENNSGSFSLPSNSNWQTYLDTNFKSTGTKTKLEDIKGIAPIAQKTENTIKAPIGPEKQIQMTQNNQNTPLRTSEQIANDDKISDLEAIKEESSKINMPTLQKANDTSNNISGNIPPDNTPPKSPTIDLVNKKRSKEKASLSQIKDTLAQKFINKGHYIDKLAKQTGNKNLTYLYDRTMNTFNEAQISIGDKQVITNASGNDIEVVGKSIIDIFSEADKSNLSNEFDDYLLNKHNISRYAYEKGVFGKEISATDSQNIVNSYEKQHPEFIKWSKEVSQYNDNNLKDLVNNGLVSKETYNKLHVMYEDYVPTFRDITENIAQFEDNFVGGNTLKKATQSDKSILSVKESMAEQTLAIKKAIRMNKLGVELYNTLGKNTKVNESVKGIEFDPVAIQTIAGDVISKAKDGTNTFMIFQDGVMTEFKISDELYSAFSKDTLQSKINNSDVAKTLLTPVEKLSKAQRELLTTYSIGFAFNNSIGDFQNALFNTKYSSFQFLKNYTKSLYNIAVDGSWYQNYKGNGGTANTYFDYETGILPNKNIKFGDAIKKANNILEQAPRLAEYISTIENGGSVDEALYNSADITTNFKRGGDITKVVNKYGANFLNASVQGLDKFYRNLTGQSGWKGYANLAVKATVWQVAPAILNGLLLGDDDDYEDLPEYTKDNYFLFKMNDGKFFRIPKGRVSSVVGGIARRALKSFQSKDVDWNALIDTAVNQMAPNNPLSDNILAPIIQAKTNKAWYGGDIVSSRLQKLPNAEQFDESTDKLSKFLGEKLNISPKKINYILDQYSGGIGDVVLPMLTPQAENNILEDKFTTDSVMKNKHVSEYYSLLDELEKSKNSINATNEDILKYKYLSDSSSDISELYQKKRAIQNSDLSDEEKKTQVREVQKQINDIVENKLENVDSVKVTNNTASIGSNKYYKYKDEWKVVSDKEANKIKGISLDIYAEYQNKVAKLSEEKKKSDESVSQKDKIKILANSNWTTNEKDKIYTQIINDDDETYAVLKKLDSSKSIINQYLDYLQNDFKADREDDGTEKGKAVSGSKKKKVYNYINGIDSNNMSYTQKLYLTGVNTSLSSSDKKKIVDYINKSNSFSKQEKLEAIDKLQGVTVYKDGRISW